MRHTNIFLLLIVAAAFFCFIESINADDAKVLPKGVFSLRLDSKFFFPIEKRFDADGNTEDLAEDFNANLNSSVFPQLGLIEQVFGMPEGTASIGESEVDLEYDVKIFNFYLFYGLTDRLTVGAKIPYWTFRSDVDAEVDNTNDCQESFSGYTRRPIYGGRTRASQPGSCSIAGPPDYRGCPKSVEDGIWN